MKKETVKKIYESTSKGTIAAFETWSFYIYLNEDEFDIKKQWIKFSFSGGRSTIT
jgi:hypothetical protein